MKHAIEVNIVDSKNDLHKVFDIRRTVFVEEQKVDEREEYDEFEDTSKHLIAICDGEAVGAARVRRTANGVKLERFAVLNSSRGKGVGEALVLKSLEMTKEYSNIYLHAQIQVVDFYKKFGFQTEGDEFLEAGIRHYKMTLKP
ncbi:MAG: GNAT family N-acetyltransferase [Bacteroidia bacterium]